MREKGIFLSSNAQDFIEDHYRGDHRLNERKFLSSNAQDFIEEEEKRGSPSPLPHIPEQ